MTGVVSKQRGPNAALKWSFTFTLLYLLIRATHIFVPQTQHHYFYKNETLEFDKHNILQQIFN